MKYNIYKKLKEHMNEYVSGEELSNELGVTRTAIWKYIRELREEGCMIESSPKKGYKLVSIPDFINPCEIMYQLNTKTLGKNIEYFDEIDSTNNYAKKIALEGCEEGTTVLADVQTAGRGRLGRNWSSMGKKGIWMSVVLRPSITPEEVQLITLAASVAVVSAIKAVTGIKAGIKWPNDIVLDGRKVCGILTEMNSEMEQVNFLVLGIGINVHQEKADFPDNIIDTATSLKLYTEEKIENTGEHFMKGVCTRCDLIKRVLYELERVYAILNMGLSMDIIEEWKAYSATLGKMVKVVAKNIEYTGMAVDITADGKLVVNCTDGRVREIVSGEVSVRGILGYI